MYFDTCATEVTCFNSSGIGQQVEVKDILQKTGGLADFTTPTWAF